MRDFQEEIPYHEYLRWSQEKADEELERWEREMTEKTNESYLINCRVHRIEPMNFYHYHTYFGSSLMDSAERFKEFSLKYLDEQVQEALKDE
jgi:2-iminoacetate synthase ThiH